MPSQKNPKPIRRKKPSAGEAQIIVTSPKLAFQTANQFISVTRPKKPKTETLPQLLKRAEKYFNLWIRRRDLLSDNTFRCISCGLFKRKSEMDAGHFYPKTYSYLRFDPDNVHGECITCNRLDDKHLAKYGLNLEEKIGWIRMERLALLKNTPCKWDRQDLLFIIENYK